MEDGAFICCEGCDTQFKTKSSLRKHSHSCRGLADEDEELAHLARSRRIRQLNEASFATPPEVVPPPQDDPPVPLASAGSSINDLQLHMALDALEEGPFFAIPDPPSPPQLPPSSTRRSTRARKPSAKVCDMLPTLSGLMLREEDAYTILDMAVDDNGFLRDLASGNTLETDTDQPTALETHLPTAEPTSALRTMMNAFNVFRVYSRTPSTIPDLDPILSRHIDTSADQVIQRAQVVTRTVAQIIAPYPNMSSWRWNYEFWVKHDGLSRRFRDDQLKLPKYADFKLEEAFAANYKHIEDQIVHQGVAPFNKQGEGWMDKTVTIGVPVMVNRTKEQRQKAATERAYLKRRKDSELVDDVPAEHPVEGQPFQVKGLWTRSIVGVIKDVWANDPLARLFHMHGYEERLGTKNRESDAGNSPAAPGPPSPSSNSFEDAERVYGQVYTSPAFLEAEAAIQTVPREEGDTLPHVVAALMFWSDATQLAQFSNVKFWPVYMFFGNLDKYIRSLPSASAAQHIAYLPSLPDAIQDWIRDRKANGKATSSMLAHCSRELIHAAWDLLLDKEFIEAYTHGIVIKCADGVTRRVFPRLFSYAADYPEKVLLATIRNLGSCPCIRCLIPKSKFHLLGTPCDASERKSKARATGPAVWKDVQKARDLIYKKGYAINYSGVEELLKDRSLVPTKNAFSKLYTAAGTDIHDVLVPDLMHEFLLGVWKSVFTHLIRVLYAQDEKLVGELDHRFREMATFGRGSSTIRRFSRNVSEMKQLAAYHYEDILRCSIPCFSGLLPDPHDGVVIDLLYTLSYWYSLAEMRLHTDSSLDLLDDATVSLGASLRRFESTVCAHYATKDTPAEVAARNRRAAAVAKAAGRPGTQTTSGRREQGFNLNTVKLHFLGDCALSIRRRGTLWSYNTSVGEREHRKVKNRYKRVSKNKATGQIVNLGIIQDEMMRQALELVEKGITVEDNRGGILRTPKPALIPAEEHHQIAIADETTKTRQDLPSWLNDGENAFDVALRRKHFLDPLREHLLMRLDPDQYVGRTAFSQKELGSVSFHKDCFYRHKTAKINYTTYDMRREQDLINMGKNKSGIMVYTPTDQPDTHPWTYARVLGVYHVKAKSGNSVDFVTVPFFWVRWLDVDADFACGAGAKRLERVKYREAQQTAPDALPAFGFVDPAHVIRSIHLMRDYEHGYTNDYLLARSIANDTTDGDNTCFYVGRFVDHDMPVRYLGLGLGHCAMQTSFRDVMPVPEDLYEGQADDVQQPTHAEEEETASPNGGIFGSNRNGGGGHSQGDEDSDKDEDEDSSNELHPLIPVESESDDYSESDDDSHWPNAKALGTAHRVHFALRDDGLGIGAER